MRRYLIGAIGTVLVLFLGAAHAHHSGAMFDITKEVKISGTIQEFNWTNPHSNFKIKVVNSLGNEELWAVEMNSPNNLVREGWKRTTLKVGDKVTVTVRPLRDGTPGGQYVSVILADGRFLGGEQKRDPSGDNRAAAPPAEK
jgi:hypothetical protein